MSALYGINATAQYVTVPGQPYPAGEHSGKKRVLFDSFVWATAVVLADTILIGKIPAGARVIDAKIFVPATSGTNGQFTLGYAANGVDIADPDAFVKLADCGGQAVLGIPTLDSAGLFKKFSVETEIILACAETTSNASGTVYAEVEYLMD